METVGSFEAKTHLSALLERVKKGERITITKHGVPTAMLVPVEEAAPKPSHEELFERMKALRKRVKPDPDGMTIKEMIEEGRRY